MYIVGFTGKSAAGKSVAAEILRNIAHVKTADIEYSDLFITVLNEWLPFISFKPGHVSKKMRMLWLMKLGEVMGSRLGQSLLNDIFIKDVDLSSELSNSLLKALDTIPSKHLGTGAMVTRETKDTSYLPLFNWLGRVSRQVIGEDVWGRVMERYLHQKEGQGLELITICGIRTPTAETLPIRSRGGLVVRVVRDARHHGAHQYENDANIQDIMADVEIECLENYDREYLYKQLVPLWNDVKNGRFPQNRQAAKNTIQNASGESEIVRSMILNSPTRTYETREFAMVYGIQGDELGQLAYQAAKELIDTNLIDTIQLMQWYETAPHMRNDPDLLAKIRRSLAKSIDEGEGLTYIVQYRSLLEAIGIELPSLNLEKALYRHIDSYRKAGLLSKELGANPVLAEHFIMNLDTEHVAAELQNIGRAVHHRNAAHAFLEQFSKVNYKSLNLQTRRKLSTSIVPLAKWVVERQERSEANRQQVLEDFFDTLENSEGIPQEFARHILANRASYTEELLAIIRRFFPDSTSEQIYFLWQGLEYYLRILENHRMPYDALYRELDERLENDRSLEVFIGRDAYYAFAGRQAQREARFIDGQKTIETSYLVYPRAFGRGLPTRLKELYICQAGVTSEANPVIVDTGYAGSIAEDILSIAGYKPEEYDDHILFLASSVPSRHLKSLSISRVQILERIEHYPQLYNSSETLFTDISGRVRPNQTSETAENQLYATMSEKAAHDFFFYQETMKLRLQEGTVHSRNAKRVGLYSGTFDPVHLGHIEIAKAAMEAAHLDEVWFIANTQPPYKKNVSPLKDRIAMLKMALQDEDGLYADADPYQSQGQRHTIETLKYMNAAHSNIVFVQISGIDSIAHLPSWTRCQELLKLTTFAIHRRPGVEDSVLHDVITRLGNLATNFRYITFDTQKADNASTDIRAAVRAGRIDLALKPAVLTYVHHNNLYT